MNSHRAWYNFSSRVAGESGQYLLGAFCMAVLANGSKSRTVQTELEDFRFIQQWGNYLLTFLNVEYGDNHSIEVYSLEDLQLVQVLRTVPDVSSSRHVFTTPHFLYCRSGHGKSLARLDSRLDEEQIEEGVGLGLYD